jgi:putative ABC transport system permease protein
MSAHLRAAVRDIADDIRARPGRAGLSFLAIGVGMTALTVLLAVLGGLQERGRQIVQELGVDVFAIVQGPGGAPGSEPLRLGGRHVDLLAANLPGCRVAGSKSYEVATTGTDRQLKVLATDHALLAIRQWRMVEGRFLDEHDVRNRERVVVLSAALARVWPWKVGDILQLRDTPFRVIGIVQVATGALDGESADPAVTPGERAVFVPRTVPPYWLTSRITPESELDSIFVRVDESIPFDRALARSRILLQQPDQKLANLSFVTPDVLLEKVRRLQATIRLTVGSIAALCLILGGTTLMSLMVANVRDRVTEIGLRRALGATAGDIAGLFVLEAILVTASAAAAGSGLTALLMWISRDAFPVPLALHPGVVLVPLVVAVLLGTLFSYGPARAAARISPAEALRNE